MTTEVALEADVDPRLPSWICEVTGAAEVRLERRTGGASRAGYAVDAVRSDGTIEALWLRVDPGFGPQANTSYTLRREAAVYRALGPTPVRVARLVGVHPDLPAVLLERARGESRYALLTDESTRRTVADELMAQLAELHALDPHRLVLPELGPISTITAHVIDELDEWDRQYVAAGGDVPVIAVAISWLRANVPVDDGHTPVLVQGDTGTGNFMFDEGHLSVITDWELAHWGDPHDDLAWVVVRHALEPLPDLVGALQGYEACRGMAIDPARLAYFIVLAQCRCTIGTLAGLRGRDSRGEIAWLLIFNALHTRLLAEALATAMNVPFPEPVRLEARPTPHSWIYDVAIDDLSGIVAPAIRDGFALNRTKGIARLIKYLSEVDRLGPPLVRSELRQLSEMLGESFPDVVTARRALIASMHDGATSHAAVLRYCLDQAGRDTALTRQSMGRLADRHLTAFPPRAHAGPTKNTGALT